MLAQNWSDVWKLTRRLRITGTAEPGSIREVREIERAPLDACEITLHEYDNGGDEEDVQRWINRAVECLVQALWIEMYSEGEVPFLGNAPPLVSSHLTRLVLCGVGFSRSFADFSSCPVLKDLEMSGCDLFFAQRMRSPSLKRLSITNCNSNQYSRFRISVPRLVWLRLECTVIDNTPLLESMPELVAAYVDIYSGRDSCNCHELMDCSHVAGDGTSSDHDEADEYSRKCVPLGGLSEAMNLTLLCTRTRYYLFRRELRWCPTFWKLKTLVLNGYWCEPADCSPLACILEHAPVLEQLSVLFTSWIGPKYKVEMEGRLDATEESALISQHLKIVKVKCRKVDERVLNVLNFLGTLNICKGLNLEEWDEGSK